MMRKTVMMDFPQEEEFFRAAVSMSINNPSNLRKIVDEVEDDSESLFTILDIAASQKGPDGVRSVLKVFQDKKMCLNPLFIKEMIAYVQQGIYGMLLEDEPSEEEILHMQEESEEMIDLYSSYPFIEEDHSSCDCCEH